MSERSALEAVERIVNRGGDPADVVDAVVSALRDRGFAATAAGGTLTIPDAPPDFATRVATLTSAYLAQLG